MPYHTILKNWKNDPRLKTFLFFTELSLETDSRRAAQSVLFLLTGRFLGFSPRTDQGEIWQGGVDRRSAPLLHAKFHLIGSWVYGPKTLKNWNFSNIIAPKWRVPCIILTKFTVFMRVLSLHKCAKFGCFFSINDKIINNLLRWGRFQPNFRRPLAAKLWMGAKND